MLACYSEKEQKDANIKTAAKITSGFPNLNDEIYDFLF